MKRKILSMLCVVLLLTMAFPALADTQPRVIDGANLLTEQEQLELEKQAASLLDRCQLDVVILTVETTYGQTVQSYADDYFDANGYGYGEDNSGLLLLLCMDTREWYISTCGQAIYIFTDCGLQEIADDFLPYLSEGDYYGAFTQFLGDIPYYCEQFTHGDTVDGYVPPDAYDPEYRDEIVYYDPEPDIQSVLIISGVIGFVTALVVVLVMASQMNTAKNQKHAGNYLVDGSYHLTDRRDLFLYSQVKKVRKQENSGSRGGGSSVHRSSGGRGHGGRGGRF